MKYFLTVLGLLCFCSLLQSQSKDKVFPISVAYYGQVLIQPGIKISGQLSLNSWEKDGKQKHLILSPQIGFFNRPLVQNSLVLNTELGLLRSRTDKKSFSILSLGLGYLSQHQISSIVYNLNDGSIKERKRENSQFFMPTINYELGRSISQSLAWYSKLSLGRKIGPAEISSTVAFVEAGLKFNFSKNQ